MEITIRYFDGCPNWQVARQRVTQTLEAIPVEERPSVKLERVETAEEAERLGFRGSPTVLIDGRDPFADDSAPVGLSCRVYRTESGFEGSPSLDQLYEVLNTDA